MKLFAIVGKNFKQIIKLKLTSVLPFILPLFIALIIALIISSTSQVTEIGFYSGNYTEESTLDLFVTLDEGNFVLLKLDSVIECKELSEKEELEGCVIYNQQYNKVTIFARQANLKVAKEITDLIPEHNVETKIIEQKGSPRSLLILLILIIIAGSGILFTSTTINSEKRSKAYFRNHITPTHDIEFILGRYLTALILLGIQLIIILSICSFFLKIDFTNYFFFNLIALILISTLFIFMGIFIGNLFRTEETNTFCALGLISAMIVFSGTVIKVKGGTFMSFIINMNPFEISSTLLNTLLYTTFETTVVLKLFIYLLIYSLILIAVILITQTQLKSINLFYHHKKGYENIKKKIEEELEAVKSMHIKEVLFEKKEKDIDKIEKKHKNILRNIFKRKTREKKLEEEIDEIDKII